MILFAFASCLLMIKLTVFRFDKLIDINFTLGSNTRRNYSFVPLPEPNELQKKLYREYLNADLQ